MRIYDRDLTGTAAAESGRARDIQRTERENAASAGSRGGAGEGDRVDLSPGLGRLAQALSAYGEARRARVETLAAAYRSGVYRPEASATGRAMIFEALHAGRG